jgi:aspartate/methionine/tyrosine aminotransferase
VANPRPPRVENRQPGADRTRFRSDRIRGFTESVIREMTRLAVHHGAVNLAQGFPDFSAPELLMEAAQKAIRDGFNQYPITWGVKPFRDAIAAKYQDSYGVAVDPEREITVCCGSTEGMMASLLAVVNPGDEIVIFEPYYENYGPDCLLCGAERRYVTLHPPDWSFDAAELAAAFTPRTKAIILNSPNNPTGKVFTRTELELIASLCQRHDALCITDEIYEHIVYDGTRHVPMLTVPGMRSRTILVNSMSKTYSVTGWRVGWVIAPPDLTGSVRKLHDFLTVGAATPLQHAGITALSMPAAYYDKLAADYTIRRDQMVAILRETGFDPILPKGAYYVMADIDGFGFNDDTVFARHLIEEVNVAAVPGSSFFEDPAKGRHLIRFCFCKKYETLEGARQLLLERRPLLAGPVRRGFA